MAQKTPKKKKKSPVLKTKARKPGKKPAMKAAPKPAKSARLPESFVPIRSIDVLARKNPDGSFSVLRLDNDQLFYSIQGIAAEAWSLIDGKTPVKAIKERLTRKHSPPADRFERDMNGFLEDLVREKLIET